MESNIAEKLDQSYKKICEDLGWRVHEEYLDSDGESRVEIEKWSPCGEDIVLDLSVDDFVGSAEEYAAAFDEDEHVAGLIEFRGVRGVPSSIRALLDDANDIGKMLTDLVQELNCARSEKESNE